MYRYLHRLGEESSINGLTALRGIPLSVCAAILSDAGGGAMRPGRPNPLRTEAVVLLRSVGSEQLHANFARNKHGTPVLLCHFTNT